MIRYSLVAVVALLVGGAAVFFLSRFSQSPVSAPEPAQSVTETAPLVLAHSNFTWVIATSTADYQGVPDYPLSKVSLKVSGSVNKTFEVGTYRLFCSEGQSFVSNDPNEISVVTCWYGGGGNELGVFKEGDRYVVKQGEVDEGSSESAGFRGNFKTLFEIK